MLAPFAFVLASAPSTPSAAQILARTQQAYDSVRSLEETVHGKVSQYNGTAHIYFQRPGKLSVAGDSMFKSKYKLVSDGRSTWVLNSGSWTQAQSPEMGVATITGISANAGMAVPAALVHARFGNVLAMQGPISVKSTTEGGKSVFLLHTQQPFPMTLWIDARTYMLVKSAGSVMNNQIVVNFDPPKINGPIPAGVFSKS